MTRALALILVVLAYDLAGLSWLGCGSGCAPTMSAVTHTGAASCGAGESGCCGAAPASTERGDDRAGEVSGCCSGAGAERTERMQEPECGGRVCVLPPGAKVPDRCPSRCCVEVPARPMAPPSDGGEAVVRHITTWLSQGPEALMLVAAPACVTIRPREVPRGGLPEATARTRRAWLCIRTT